MTPEVINDKPEESLSTPTNCFLKMRQDLSPERRKLLKDRKTLKRT